MAKEFCVCISHLMMGAASTGTGTTGFFSFFIDYQCISEEWFRILILGLRNTDFPHE